MKQAILAAMTLTKTGGDARTQEISSLQKQTQNQQAQSNAYNAQLHPKGADGRFITTGGTVVILGADGKPVSEGTVTAVNPTGSGTMLTITNPTTGQVSTVAPNQVRQAPQSIATLSAKGTQGIPTGPGAAARAAKSDARLGVPPRSGKDALGQQSSKDLMKAYTDAYQAEAAKVAAAAAKKAAALAKKNSTKAGGSAYKPPASVKTNTRRFYK